MTRLFSSLCLLLLPVNLLIGEEKCAALFDRAEQLFAATLYQEAIPLYTQVQDPLLVGKASLRIGQALFYESEYPTALAYLQKNFDRPLSCDEDEEKILFAALCHRHLEHYNDVIASLSNRAFAKYRSESLFELGLAHYLAGHQEEALKSFALLKDMPTNAEIYVITRFYLARLAVAAGKPKEAEQMLDELEVADNKKMRQELAFLKGQAAFHAKEYQKSVKYFQEVLPEKASLDDPWSFDALYYLGWSHLKLAENEDASKDQQENSLREALAAFGQLSLESPSDLYSLALANAYLIKAEALNDPTGNISTEQILSERGEWSSSENEDSASLMSARAKSQYEDREAAYRRLTEISEPDSPLFTKAWYLRGVNHLEEAQKAKSARLYADAANAFSNAYRLSINQNDGSALMCLKLHAQALWEQGSMSSRIEALLALESALESRPSEESLNELYGSYAVHLISENAPVKFLSRIEAILKRKIIEDNSEAASLALAAFYLKQGRHEESFSQYMHLAEKRADSPLIARALLQASIALEHCPNKQEAVKELRRRIYTEYPCSEEAPLAYFLSYTYQDYLQGDRKAIKHLDGFKERFPRSRLLMNINYLLGLDLKRDRKTPEGKWVRKKSPTQSVQAFVDVETAFDSLLREQKIPDSELDYYIQLRYRASLEKGLVHYEVAESSSAAKKDIYLQYAIDAFEHLRRELEEPNHPLSAALKKDAPFSSLHEECLYRLMLAYSLAGDDNAAQEAFDDMLALYRQASVASGYYYSKAHQERGAAALRKEDHAEAIKYFLTAEEASKGKYLSTDEKLDLWICQSICYEATGQNEQAMLALSKVINDDSISHLRLKAMLMRAGLYEKMGRPELARRQLEFVAKLNGEWAELAKLKLDSEYAN